MIKPQPNSSALSKQSANQEKPNSGAPLSTKLQNFTKEARISYKQKKMMKS